MSIRFTFWVLEQLAIGARGADSVTEVFTFRFSPRVLWANCTYCRCGRRYDTIPENVVHVEPFIVGYEDFWLQCVFSPVDVEHLNIFVSLFGAHRYTGGKWHGPNVPFVQPVVLVIF